MCSAAGTRRQGLEDSHYRATGISDASDPRKPRDSLALLLSVLVTLIVARALLYSVWPLCCAWLLQRSARGLAAYYWDSHRKRMVTNRPSNHNLTCLATFALLLLFGSPTFGFLLQASIASRRSFLSVSSSSATAAATSTMLASSTPTYWNRETSLPQDFDSNALITRPARIVSVSDPSDGANEQLSSELPEQAQLVAVGSTLNDFDIESLRRRQANVVFVSSCPAAREVVAALVEQVPSIEWVHARSAGIDFVTSQELSAWSVGDHIVTNAKGSFSSTLAEYTML